MNFIEQIERIKTANKLIKEHRTGNPEEFAMRLGISKRHLYNLLDFLRDNEAPVKYSRRLQTFCFEQDGLELEINFSIKTISPQGAINISGGYFKDITSVQFYFTQGSYF